MEEKSTKQLLEIIADLQGQLSESQQLIDAIKAGEVDAFALRKENKSEIFTLQSGDYAYRILVENFSEGALNLADDGLIVYTNTYFHKLLNLPYDAVIAKSIFHFIHKDSIELFEKILKKGIENEDKGEINLCAGEKIIPVYVSLTSLHPVLQSVGMLVTDLSEKKISEKNLAHINQQLEDKNAELLKSNKELASFSYIASHDLQEPLRKIRTFSTLLLEKEFGNISENGQMIFGRIQNAAQRMQKLIDDLLTYSRTNPETNQFEILDFNNIVADVKNEMKEELEEKNAEIIIEGNCKVSVLYFQFNQLLHNLIGNSLKFTQPDKNSVLHIKSQLVFGKQTGNELLKKEKQYCHIEISDNGIGFEPEFNEKIFELFQKLNSKDQYEGTGIGLSIVKKIVENHNGFISASGKINEGAIFDIYLPAYLS